MLVQNRFPYPNSASSRTIKKPALAETKMPAKAGVKPGCENAPKVWAEKAKEKSPQKWIIPPGV